MKIPMGYVGNHLATLVTAVFAAILTGLWPIFVDFADILWPVFMMAVPIAWFMAFTCWISQKSTDYMHKHGAAHGTHAEKKSLTSSSRVATQIYTSEGKIASKTEIKEAKTELSGELNELRDTLKLKDTEIERLKQEIANLETIVQIESLKSELANLKMLASKEKSSKK